MRTHTRLADAPTAAGRRTSGREVAALGAFCQPPGPKNSAESRTECLPVRASPHRNSPPKPAIQSTSNPLSGVVHRIPSATSILRDPYCYRRLARPAPRIRVQRREPPATGAVRGVDGRRCPACLAASDGVACDLLGGAPGRRVRGAGCAAQLASAPAAIARGRTVLGEGCGGHGLSGIKSADRPAVTNSIALNTPWQ